MEASNCGCAADAAEDADEGQKGSSRYSRCPHYYYDYSNPYYLYYTTSDGVCGPCGVGAASLAHSVESEETPLDGVAAPLRRRWWSWRVGHWMDFRAERRSGRRAASPMRVAARLPRSAPVRDW